MFVAIEMYGKDEYIVYRMNADGEEDMLKIYSIVEYARAYAEGLQQGTEAMYNVECPIYDDTRDGD